MFFVKKPRLPLFLSISYFWFTYETSVTVLQQIGKVHDHQYQALLCTFIRNLSYFPECFTTCHRLFSNLLWIFRGHSPECLATFPGMFEVIPRSVWRHSPECLRSFPGMFENIPRNITFPLFLAFSAFRSPFLYS